MESENRNPVRALILQCAISLVLVIVLGSFEEIIIYTAAAVYTFYLATSVAVFVLRKKEPGVHRPYRVTGYPYTTLIFCAVCAYLIYSAVTYKPTTAVIAGCILLAGVPIYRLSKYRDR